MARTLVFSLRNLKREIFRCHDFEFEDVILETDDAELYLPSQKFENRLYLNIAEAISRKTLNIPWSLPFNFPSITKTYDLFFANMTFIYDLEILHRMPDWRSHVGYSICYIDELFTHSISRYSKYLEVLNRFDCVVLNCSGSVVKVAEQIQAKTLSFPSGVDASRFFPKILHSQRCIDVYSMGRRDDLQHKALMRLQQESQWFYMYDTITPNAAIDHVDHRINLAKLLSRTKFFTVNPAKFNSKRDSGMQEEIGFRYFEGASSGCVMIGKIPENENYKKLFPWEESVIEIPVGNEDAIIDFMIDLDRDRDRLQRICYDNVLGTLRMHDFVFRWKDILSANGFEPLPGTFEREAHLNFLENQWIAKHQ